MLRGKPTDEEFVLVRVLVIVIEGFRVSMTIASTASLSTSTERTSRLLESTAEIGHERTGQARSCAVICTCAACPISVARQRHPMRFESNPGRQLDSALDSGWRRQ